jgi:hypothetical protein
MAISEKTGDFNGIRNILWGDLLVLRTGISGLETVNVWD